MTIAFGQYGIPQGDVIECRVHLGCTKEVSSFELLLQNWDGKYSPNGSIPLAVGMDGHIDIGRGSNVPQLITCRIESLKHESTATEHYTRVSGRCWGEKLFRRVVTKKYENKKGEEIVKDLIDYYVGLSHVRDSTELIENTDTTYTFLEYEDTPVFDILKYIAESADKNGVIGFDFRIAGDAKFEFFPRLSKTSPISLSEKIEEAEYRKDIHVIRNKITVYGAAEKAYPSDRDGCTEYVSWIYGSWSVGAGDSINRDTSIKCWGDASIRLDVTTANYYGSAVFTFVSGNEADANKYPSFSLRLRRTSDFNGAVNIYLEDDSGKLAYRNISIPALQWVIQNFPCGEKQEAEWHFSERPFNWSKIKKIRIDMPFNGTGTGSFWIDGLFFNNRRFSSTQEDMNSQNAYGLRELTETDEELHSDEACMFRAKALLDYLKNPAEYLTIKSTVIDYGNTPILAGDKIHVTLPNENVDADFRVLSAEYHVDAKTQTLTITLELGKETPLLADYLYALKSKTAKTERYKIARV
jgi:hypothetical protein